MTDTESHLTTLRNDFGLHPVFAVELEFYVYDAMSEAEILETLDSICKDCHPGEKERGENQYEIALMPVKDVAEFIRRATNLRKVIAAHFDADFRAKPFSDDYGSALHFHLHLEDENGRNVFTRSVEGEYSAPLLHTLGGLLATMQENLKIFSPNNMSRFTSAGKNAPTHLSWGPNNRSVALRLPDKPLDNKHIEHRVASADANIAECVQAILQGVVYGLQHQSDPGEPTYGNAWDNQYTLKPLLG